LLGLFVSGCWLLPQLAPTKMSVLGDGPTPMGKHAEDEPAGAEVCLLETMWPHLLVNVMCIDRRIREKPDAAYVWAGVDDCLIQSVEHAKQEGTPFDALSCGAHKTRSWRVAVLLSATEDQFQAAWTMFVVPPAHVTPADLVWLMDVIWYPEVALAAMDKLDAITLSSGEGVGDAMHAILSDNARVVQLPMLTARIVKRFTEEHWLKMGDWLRAPIVSPLCPNAPARSYIHHFMVLVGVLVRTANQDALEHLYAAFPRGFLTYPFPTQDRSTRLLQYMTGDVPDVAAADTMKGISDRITAAGGMPAFVSSVMDLFEVTPSDLRESIAAGHLHDVKYPTSAYMTDVLAALVQLRVVV
jgi:hypothetical protein